MPPRIPRSGESLYVATHRRARNSEPSRNLFPYHEGLRRVASPHGKPTCARRPGLSPDAAFAHYPELRADALLSDDYYAK